MTQVNMHEAKSQLSKLIEKVEGGEKVVIARAGVPVVEINAIPAPTKARVPGRLKGKIKMLPGFDDIPEEFLEIYKG